MEPALDETSLVPCAKWAPAIRIAALSTAIKEFDRVGLPRVLRSVSDAVDRDISEGRGLRSWCFDRGLNRDAGLLVASRLARPPFIDGTDGLLARAEGNRILETQANGTVVYGLGLGALEGGPVALLSGRTVPVERFVEVQILDASTDPITVTQVSVVTYSCGSEVSADASDLQCLVDASMSNGQVLLERAPEVLPHLHIGPRAADAFAALTGAEPVFQQLIRHLRALNSAAVAWAAGAPYQPRGITFSPESDQTLSHGRFGPLRDFPAPDGFPQERWTLHTKLTGGAGARMYFRAVQGPQGAAVLIGYFGPHLPCVRYP
jgi:hypothetical protein